MHLGCSNIYIINFLIAGTYPTYVQHEVEASEAQEVIVGPEGLIDRLLGKVNVPFTVKDGGNNYVSARWPGDTWALAELFILKLKNAKNLMVR